MIEGIVIKAYSGYYYVQTEQEMWTCRLRGKFRLDKQNVFVGDKVKLKPAENNTGTVYEVLPRQNEMVRPSIANVDQAMITFAVEYPEPNLDLLDRFLLLAGISGIHTLICLNKADLLSESEPPVWLKEYSQANYQVVLTSTKTGQGIETLRQCLKDKISVLAGPSGVGKSSLLNALQPGLQLKTGEISRKLGRGKHTTRHVELMPLKNGGLVADTPGFTNLFLPEIPKGQLANYFPDIQILSSGCRFNGCTHDQEPECAVKLAVEKGEISQRRYQSYLKLLKELNQLERRY